MFDPINLDDISTEPKNYLAMHGVFNSYAQYCFLKESAMTLRVKGKIGAAMLTEKKMETLYKSLPKWAQW